MRLDISPSSASGGGYSVIKNEGVDLTQRTTIDFVGAGVAASDSGSVTTVTIAGAAGISWAETEIDFGDLPAFDAQFVITDAASITNSIIIIGESGKAAADRVEGDSQWDAIALSALPADGEFTIYALANPGPVVGKRKIHYCIA